jgi:O-antigen/teichoic acid export membrane protein
MVDQTDTDSRTEDLPAGQEVGRLARRGTLWGVIAQVAQQALSVIATMILARLLTPADFGVVAASVTVLQLVQLVLGLGWGAAIVRRREVDDTYLSSIFWLATGMGVTLAAGMAVGAPLLAGIVGLSGVASYIAVLGLTCIPGAALVVPQSLLQRRLELQTMHLVLIVSVAAYVLVQVTLALLGAGAWSIILGLVAQVLVQFIGMSIGSRWWPRLVFRWAIIREDLCFAGGLLLNNGLSVAVRNGDYLLVGRFLGAPALGVYYVAYVLPQILRQRVTWAAAMVLFPVLARSQSDRERTQQVYNHTHLLLAWIGCPAMVGLAVLAEPVVQVFFGNQWNAAVAPLRWLAFVALLEFVTFGPPLVATVHGQVRRLLVTNIVRLVLLVIAVVVAGTAFRSVAAVAAGVFFATLLWAVYQQLALARPLGLAFVSPLKGLSAIAFLGTVMGLSVSILLAQISRWPSIVQLMTCTIAGAVLYVALGRLLFRDITVPLVRSVRMILQSGGRAA